MMPNSKARRSLMLKTALCTGVIVMMQAPLARAAVTLPTGSTVVSGAANISTVGTVMTVDVQASSPVITWKTFSVPALDTVKFVSNNPGPPGGVDTAQRAVLNRVIGDGTTLSPSIINGLIDSTNGGHNNIQVWLVNPAGITFGALGAYNGGSLVLSTLDVPDVDFNAGAAASTHFSKYTLGVGLAYDASATKAITLDALAGAIQSTGSILLLGQSVSVGNTVSATDKLTVVAADDVTFASGVGSPLSFTINSGSTLLASDGTGVRILGTANMSGKSITVAAVSQAAALTNVLQVDSGATLTATDTNGVISLATKTLGTVTVLGPDNNDSLVDNSGVLPGKGLIASGPGGAIDLASAGTITLAGNMSATSGTASIAVDGAKLSFGAGAIKSAGNQTFLGASTLTTDTTLVSTGGVVKFGQTIDSDATARKLTVTGSAEFDGGIGGTNALSALSVSGQTKMSAASVKTTGTQTYTGAVTLGVDTVLTAPTVDFTAAVNGAFVLGVIGNASFGGSVGAGAALTSFSVSGTAALNGGSVKTSGAQNYGGVVTLGADTTLTSSAGLVKFGESLDSDATARALAISGNAEFDTAVGANHALASLSVSGTSALDGAIVKTTGLQTYTGAATLGINTALSGSVVGFGSTLDGGFTLGITGNGSFGGAVGVGSMLTSLAVSGTTALNGGAVKTSGTQGYTGAVTLGADAALTGTTVSFGGTVDGAHALGITGNGSFSGALGATTPLASVSVSGTSALNGGSVKTSGNQTYTGVATLGANSTLTSSGGLVKFVQTVDSDATARSLSIVGNGEFDSVVGGTNALTTLAVSGTGAINGGTVTTTGAQTYGTATTLGAATTLNSAGLVKFGGTLDSDTTARALTVLANAEFDGTVGGTHPLAQLTVNAPTTITASSNISAVGTIALDAATSISVAGLSATGATSDIAINQAGGTVGTVALNGAITTGRNYLVKATSVALGNGVQSAPGKVDITATTGDISGGNASLTSQTGNVVLDAAIGTITLGTGSALTANSGNVGIRYGAGSNVGLGDVSAMTFGEVDAAHAVFSGALATAITNLTTGAVTTTANPINIKVGGALTMGAANSTGSVTLEGASVALGTALSTSTATGYLVTADTGTITLAGTVNSGVGTQTYAGAAKLGADTALTGSTIAFSSTLDGTHALTVTGNGNFTGVIGGTTPLASLSVSGTSTLNGGAVTTTGTQTYTSALTLSGNTLLSGSTIGFGSTLDGAYTLGITGNASFAGAVGTLIELTSLSVSGTSAINGGYVFTSGSQLYSGAVTLGADTFLLGTTLGFGATVDGAQSLVVDGNGTFGGAVGGTTALTSLLVAGTSALNGGSIKTSGYQTYDGAVTLGTGNTLTSTSGLVQFVQTLNSDATARALSVVGNAEFDSVVGGLHALASLSVSGTSALNGGAVTTTGLQTYSGAATLGATSTLTGSSVGFGSTLNGPYALTIAGGASFGGVVGGTTALTSLSVSGASALNGGTITTTAGQTYSGAATLGADATLVGTTVGFGATVDGAHALVVTGNGSFGGASGATTTLASLAVSGTSALNGGSVKTSGNQTYGGAATLGADATLTSTGGLVKFTQTLNSDATARALSVVGNAEFDSSVGASKALASLIVSGTSALNGSTVTTTGNQTYSGAATLGTSMVLTGAAVGFGSTLDGAFALGITGNGSFGDAVGSTTALTGLTVSGTSALNGGSIKTSGAQTYTGAATLGADAALSGSTIAFGATVEGPHALGITGNGSFGGALGGTSALTSVAVSGTSALGGGTVKTSGDQTYTGAATLGADSTLTSSTGLVKFGATLGGMQSLSVAGNAEFDGTVGAAGALTSLAVSKTTAINGGSVTTSGAQNYTGAVTLDGVSPTVLTTGTGVTFGSTLDGANALSIAGNAEFDGAVGGTTALASLLVSQTSLIKGGAVTTTGGQTYTGAVTLAGVNPDVLTGTLVKFASTLDGANALTIVGGAEFDGAVGVTTTLISLGVSNAATILGGAVSTSGGQTYSGGVTLNANATLTSASGLVKFAQTLNSDATARALSIAGNAEFDGAVGTTSALASVAVSKATAINGGAITTTGAQGYTGAVTLGGVSPTVLTTGTGVTFGAALDGANALSIAGNAEFDGAVGGSAALTSLLVSQASTIKGGAVTTTGGQTYTGGVTLAGVTPTVLNTGTLAKFGATLDGANALSIAGNAEFDGAVGGTTMLTSLGVSGTSLIAGGAVSTTGAQNYTGAVTLAGISPTVLTTGTLATFASTLDGANALSVAGNAAFDGAVGGATALTSLLVSQASTIKGGAVTTTGGQAYTGAVTLAGVTPTTLTSGTTVVFGSALDGANALSVVGNAEFDGTVGGTTALTSLMVSKTSLITGGAVTTMGAQTYTGAVTLGGVTPTVLNTGTLATFGSTLDGANALSIAGNAEFDGGVGGTTALTSLAVSQASAINGGTITTAGAQIFIGAVTLGGLSPTVLTTGTGVTFSSTLDGANALSIAGNAEFDGAVGATTTLASLAVSNTSTIKGGVVTTTGGQMYTGGVTLGGVTPTVLTTGTLAKFGATLDGGNALSIAGNAEFDGAVGATTALASLAVSKTSLIDGGSVTTSGGQTYTGAVTLAGISPTLLTTGTIATFGSTLNGVNALSIAGNAEFDGAVGTTTALASLAVSKTSLIDGGAITTTGGQTYTGAVTLGGVSPTVLTGTQVSFTSTLDGGNALSIAGTAVFGGAVGTTTALTSLAVSGTSALNGGSVTTSGAQVYTGAASLGADTTLTSTSGLVTFGAALDGAHSLSVIGNGEFDGAVGGSTALTSLTVSQASTIKGGSVTTSGAQTYTGAVTLGGVTPTVLTTGTLATFGSTLDGPNALSIAGNAEFDGAVGGTTALASLAVSQTSLIKGGAVTTAGSQTYTGAVTLDGVTPTVLTGTTATFGATLDGANALSIVGNAEFDGVVGGTTALASLAVSQASSIKGGAITTTGAQTYSGAVTLAGISPTLLTSDTTVTFGSTLDGVNALSVAGNAEFDGAVGGTTALASLAVSNASTIKGGAITTTGAQTYTGAVTLGGTSPTVLTTGSGVIFASTLDGGNALSVAGNAEFDGAVGGTAALASLAVSQTSLIKGGVVTTTGGQTYTGAETLAGVTPTTLTTGGTATFSTTLDGVNALTIAGNAAFDGVVGGTTALASVAVSGTSAINGGAVTTVGNQTYTGAATLGANTAFTTGTTGAIGLGVVNAGANTVTLTTADATLGGLITASAITVIDNGAAGNTLYLGDAGTDSTGFHLDQGEINNLNAASVVLDAGTGAAATHQDVAIGNVSLTNAALRTLGVYGLGRIDITGNLVTGTGSGLTTLQLGGTSTVSGTNLASVLRIAATTNGDGGRIAIGNGALDLRAASIGVGLDTGFLKVLGVTPGSTASQTATFMVSNASSALYNAQVGGAAYTGAGRSLIVAGSMTVRYSNFALFQNTGGAGTNFGVALASSANPGMPALSLAGPNPPNGGPFAIFGQINGVSNIPAAVLGPTTIVINAVDRTTARINGCLIGSGAGCLTSTALSTSLADIDPARTTIILANANFELPFDPLVATNNDSLFGDVGTFGLSDIAEPPVDCVPGGKETCAAHKEGKPQ